MKRLNKRGFTLVELLAVIAIMALIAGISVPNVLNMLEKGKKEDYISDAKQLIAKAKYKYGMEKYQTLFTTDGACKIIIASNLDFNKTKDSFGGTYDLTNSKVKICEEESTDKYYVKLESNTKKLQGDYVEINNLNYNIVIDK